MKRQIQPGDAERLPGFQLEENGYSFDSRDGRIRYENCFPMDQCFGSSLFGILNISLALRRVAGATPQAVPIDGALKKNIAKLEYDHRLVKQMSCERRDEPILMLIAYDGLNVIDGTHRLKRRIKDGLTDVKVYILRPETLIDMRVTVFKVTDGNWIQVNGLSDEALSAQVEQAQLQYRRMFGALARPNLKQARSS